MNKFPMTIDGANILRIELNKLKFEDRPKISKKIGIARELGDLKENGDYHAAKNEQGLVEARIRYLEGRLANANIIDITKITSDKVIFGCTVLIENTLTDEKFLYKIVGEDEADAKHNKISVTAPLSRALIGKQIDDCAEVLTPNGSVEYLILDIKYV